MVRFNLRSPKECHNVPNLVHYVPNVIRGLKDVFRYFSIFALIYGQINPNSGTDPCLTKQNKFSHDEVESINMIILFFHFFSFFIAF